MLQRKLARFVNQELAAIVASYMTLADIACAIVICKEWSRQFQPFLWTSYSSKCSRLPVSILARNLHHIRTIELDGRDFRYIRKRIIIHDKAFDEILKALACGELDPEKPSHLLDAAKQWITNLECSSHNVAYPQVETRTSSDLNAVESRHSSDITSVSVSQQSAERGVINLKHCNIAFHGLGSEQERLSWCYFQELLRNNSNTLTHLQVKTYGTSNFISPQLIPAISLMHRLQHLTISTRTQKETWFMSLLQACLPLPRLSELYCNFSVDSDGHSLRGSTGDDLTDPTEKMKAMLEKAIAARTSDKGSTVVKINAFAFPGPNEDIVLRIVLPLLRSELVAIDTLKAPVVRDDRASSFVRGMTGLKSVRDDGSRSGRDFSAAMIAQDLVRHQGDTLEYLPILEGMRFSHIPQRTLLTSCKKLKRFWLDIRFRGNDVRLRFEDIIGYEWSCLGLRELGLSLDRRLDVESIVLNHHQELSALSARPLAWEGTPPQRWMHDLDPADKEELSRVADSWAARQVYSQIGRLTGLEVLLNKLRHVHMQTEYWSRMG
ncbi:unnamed protein product [Mortierella alpina]